LEVFGLARHYRLPPSLIRTGGSLREPQPRASSTLECRRASCLTTTSTPRYSSCRLICTVLAASGMEPVVDPPFNWVFVGSM
jgi:hypothetical protein